MIYTVILNNSLSEKDGKANNLGCAYKCDAAADDAVCSLNANARPCRHTHKHISSPPQCHSGAALGRTTNRRGGSRKRTFLGQVL